MHKTLSMINCWERKQSLQLRHLRSRETDLAISWLSLTFWESTIWSHNSWFSLEIESVEFFNCTNWQGKKLDIWKLLAVSVDILLCNYLQHPSVMILTSLHHHHHLRLSSLVWWRTILGFSHLLCCQSLQCLHWWVQLVLDVFLNCISCKCQQQLQPHLRWRVDGSSFDCSKLEVVMSAAALAMNDDPWLRISPDTRTRNVLIECCFVWERNHWKPVNLEEDHRPHWHATTFSSEHQTSSHAEMQTFGLGQSSRDLCQKCLAAPGFI